jgi:hypothetical protein
MTRRTTAAAAAILLVLSVPLVAGSLDFPSSRWGVSFGNSRNFTGLRFNFRDQDVEHIRGVNVTLWQPREKTNEEAVVDGVSLGLIPGAGTLRGLQIGLLGVAGYKEIRGLTFGLLGAGSGGSVKGVNIGGLGVGAGGDVLGIYFGGLGVGAGRNVVGINVGGLGVGAGGDLVGLNFGGLGLGAGGRLRGVNIAGLGAGAGTSLDGLTVAGLAAGGERVRGVIVAGLAAGGMDVRGILVAGAFTAIPRGGEFCGLAVSPVNWHKGTQAGLSVGIVNYAWTLKGVQLGLVNIVRDNPPGLRVLPLFNAGF